jgi:hypothetical protein
MKSAHADLDQAMCRRPQGVVSGFAGAGQISMNEHGEL